MSTVLVVGATGSIGRLVVEEGDAPGLPDARAGVRDRGPGAERARGRATWSSATSPGPRRCRAGGERTRCRRVHPRRARQQGRDRERRLRRGTQPPASSGLAAGADRADDRDRRHQPHRGPQPVHRSARLEAPLRAARARQRPAVHDRAPRMVRLQRARPTPARPPAGGHAPSRRPERRCRRAPPDRQSPGSAVSPPTRRCARRSSWSRTTGPEPDDLDALFGALEADPAGALDGVQETAEPGAATRNRNESVRPYKPSATRREATPMSEVIVVIGPGLIGQAISARRVGVGKHVVLADLREANANAAAETLGNAGYEREHGEVDASSREAVEALLEPGHRPGRDDRADPRGRGLTLRRRRRRRSSRSTCTARRSCSSSRQRHRRRRLGRRDRVAVRAPASGPARRAEPGVRHDAGRGVARAAVPPARPGTGLPARLPARQARQRVAGDGRSGPLGQARRRINTISPGIVITPLAKDELTGPRGARATGA